MIDLSRLAFVNPSFSQVRLSTLFTLSATLFSTQIFAEIKTFDRSSHSFQRMQLNVKNLTVSIHWAMQHFQMASKFLPMV